MARFGEWIVHPSVVRLFPSSSTIPTPAAASRVMPDLLLRPEVEVCHRWFACLMRFYLATSILLILAVVMLKWILIQNTHLGAKSLLAKFLSEKSEKLDKQNIKEAYDERIWKKISPQALWAGASWRRKKLLLLFQCTFPCRFWSDIPPPTSPTRWKHVALASVFWIPLQGLYSGVSVFFLKHLVLSLDPLCSTDSMYLNHHPHLGR